MVSRDEVELLLKTQRDSYNDSIKHIINSFENRIQNLESNLSETKLELASVRRLNEEQNSSISHLVSEIEELKLSNSSAISSRMDYLEDQSRRNNLRFDGLPEESEENWEQTSKKVQDLVKNKLGINQSVTIERAHRVGKRVSSKPRTIVAKFLRFGDRDNIVRNSKKLKGTNLFINEDLCEGSRAIRREKLPKLKEARAAGKIAYFSHTNLIIRDKDSADPSRLVPPEPQLSSASASNPNSAPLQVNSVQNPVKNRPVRTGGRK